MKSLYMIIPASLIAVLVLLGSCSDMTREASRSGAGPAPEQGVIARVGDQAITFDEINTMLNSSAVVGLSIPALGTPARDVARITLLDNMVSANLLYLDALRQGLDSRSGYREALRHFSDGMLADLYYQRELVDGVTISQQEVEDFFQASILPGTELTDDVRHSIEASLRKGRIEKLGDAMRDQLRAKGDVFVYANTVMLEGDSDRKDDVVVARILGEPVLWGEVKDLLQAVGRGAVLRDPLAMENDARRIALQREIDTRLLAHRARDRGLDQDPLYQRRLEEFGKTRLINMHRAQLARQLEPRDEELKAYYDANRERIMVPEMRKLQMVVLKSREQAETIKAQIEAGELTMHRAAAEHSIAANANQNLGEIGWVSQGQALPQLDDLAFSLLPAEIGGPAQLDGSWHLLTVLDVRDAQYAKFSEPNTRQHLRRRYIHEKLDDYVVELRKQHFAVEVYEDEIFRLAQQEADQVRQLAELAKDPQSVTQQRLVEMRERMQAGGAIN